MAAGARVRAAGRPEPANPIAEEPEWEVPERRPPRAPANGRPREHTEVTQVLRERPPAWEGDAPEPPGRAERRRAAPDEPDEPRATRRTAAPTACSERTSARRFRATLRGRRALELRMRRVLLALAVLVVLPASTEAAPPWSAPRDVSGPHTCSSTACGPAAG